MTTIPETSLAAHADESSSWIARNALEFSMVLAGALLLAIAVVVGSLS